MRVRQAQPTDLPGVARVYLAAFPETIEQIGARRLQSAAVEDMMRVCLRAEPEGFLVAESEGVVAGYAVCPSRSDRIWRTALREGHVAAMLWRWVTGRYGLGLRPALRLVMDKLHFWRASGVPGADCRARVLSIAVDPGFQGRGIGRRLLEAGLAYLRAREVPCVRLEVRPDNVPAKRLYEGLGFEPAGTVHDTRGPWLVMVLRWPDDAEARA